MNLKEEVKPQNYPHLVEKLKEQGLNQKLVDAFLKFNRTDFLPVNQKHLAHLDEPVEIYPGINTSQPYTIAVMLTRLELEEGQKVLEIGTGMGWQTAIIAELVSTGEVYSYDVKEELVKMARKNIEESGLENIHIGLKDASEGDPENAPFDRIISCAEFQGDVPRDLMYQLSIDGVLVAPVKTEGFRGLFVIKRRSEGEFSIERVPGFKFIEMSKGENN